MTKREKVIVAVMVAAVVAGGLQFLLPLGDKEATALTPDLTELITQVQTRVQAGQLDDRERAILERAARPWSRDPFITHLPIAADSSRNKAEEESTQGPVYSGYIAIGNRALAIIDGREYRADDFLNGREYRVVAIHPEGVQLIREGATSPIRIPLIEEPHHEEP